MPIEMLLRSSSIGHNSRRGRPAVTCAITLDPGTDTLKDLYPSSSGNNAYADSRRFLEGNGFDHMQGSVHFGNDTIDTVSRVLVAQQLSDEFDWF